MSYSFSVGALDIGVFFTGHTSMYMVLVSAPDLHGWRAQRERSKQQFAELGWQKVGTDAFGSFLLSPQPSASRCFRDFSTGMEKRAKETVATRVCGVRCWRWGCPMKGHRVTCGFPVDLAVCQELCALNGAPWFRLSTTPNNCKLSTAKGLTGWWPCSDTVNKAWAPRGVVRPRETALSQSGCDPSQQGWRASLDGASWFARKLIDWKHFIVRLERRKKLQCSTCPESNSEVNTHLMKQNNVTSSQKRP